MNYAANTYHYRQDSSFLYFFGLASPGLAAIVDADEGTDTLYGDDIGIEDIIWMGNLPKIKDRALEVGVRKVAPRAAFEEAVRQALAAGRPVHYLPPYRADNAIVLSELLGIPRQGAQGQGLGRLHQGLGRPAHPQVQGRGPRDRERPWPSAGRCTWPP